MASIWAKQSEHVACLQDPPGVRLYQQTSTIRKGGVELPVYKCARGSTSLECFHLHLARFIPGTLASATNFQVYLLDGIFRWNADRAAEAEICSTPDIVVPTNYSGSLKNQTNKLWEELCGKPFFPNFKAPAKYTGELVGVQYLYDQTGQVLPDITQTRVQLENDENQDTNIPEDEGFAEMAPPQVTAPEDMALISRRYGLPESVASPQSAKQPSRTERPILHIPSETEYRQMAMEGLEPPLVSTTPTSIDQRTTSIDQEIPSSEESKHADQSSDVLGPDNVPGYDKVIKLAEDLVKLREEKVLSSEHTRHIVHLWDQLSDFDKSRTLFPKRFTKKPWSGKFGGRGKHVTPGVESIRKALLCPNQGPAQWPNCIRYTEAICEFLLKTFPGDQRREGRTISRWRLIISAYHHIQRLVVKTPEVRKHTEIILPQINQKTLM